MKLLAKVVLGALMAGASHQALAQMIASPGQVQANGRTGVGGSFVLSSVDYDVEDFPGDLEIDRKILAVDGSMGLSANFDLFAQLGYIFDAEVEDSDADGDGGFLLGFGPRFVVHEARPLRVVGYGMLGMLFEDYENDGLKSEVSLTELHLGVTAGYTAAPRVTPYIGLELVPLSDGKIKSEYKIGNVKHSSKADIERDDVLVLRLGASFALSPAAALRADLALVGETTITLGGGTTF